MRNTTTNGIPEITDKHFEHEDVNHIMAFDNGQTVVCYGRSIDDKNYQELVDKCENYYLKHHSISKYEIHVRPEHLRTK